MKTLAANLLLEEHIQKLRLCKLCPNMIGPVVTHTPVISKVYLIGQAPGPREGAFGRPFAWTAGKTLFRWFASIGLDEQQFRTLAYMSAVCRCFPGKSKGGGDRVPTPVEIKSCLGWMEKEIELLRPQLIIPVGRLAIEQVLGKQQLIDVIGKQFCCQFLGTAGDIIPLPHPSGASTWFKREPGQSLLQDALRLLQEHSAWQDLVSRSRGV